jgi:sialic acid synthase SpsE
MKPFTIAELGSNPAPFTKDRIEHFLLWAAGAGADAVKIQLFRADHFPNEERAAKQKLEFPRELFSWYLERARFHRLQGGASTFDKDAIDLCNRLGADFIKLATREQSNRALREHAQKFKGTIYRSVDFETLDEYEPRMPREVTLGCITRYPTAFTYKMKRDMLAKFRGKLLPEPWGWSSHTVGIDDVLIATNYGAKAVEKHFCLSRDDAEARWSLDVGHWMMMEGLIENVHRL